MEEATPMYYCHMCSLIIRPVVSVEEEKCPHCRTGFVEEMAAGRQRGNAAANRDRAVAQANADAAAPERDDSRRSPVLMDFSAASSGGHGLAAFARRQQYRNIALMQLLHALQEQEGGTGRERVVLISPADARAMLARERAGTGLAARGLTFGDLFLAPGMDLLLEYMPETDPSQQGTPPARKQSVAALPTVWVREAASCPVCLDELAAGDEAREMPCKHVFHDGCILPWLEMHSSCPVCRYQLPTEDQASGSGSSNEPGRTARGERGSNAGSSSRRHWFSWPFGRLFSQRSNGTPRHRRDDNQNP
jgi:E3 ubiquitin-protein ligase RNF115/126